MSGMASQIIASWLSTQPFIHDADKKKPSKLRVTDLCGGISPVTDEFPAQIASNAENVFIWWRHQISVRYDLLSVWVRLSIFSQLSIIQYVGLCVFSLPISFVKIDKIYILRLIIIIKSEVWTITHCLGLGHETMVWAVCLSIFLWA